jgi:hypothetical protein
VTAIAAVIGAIAAFLVARGARRAKRRRMPGRALIVSPRQATVVAKDGTVRSVQSAELTVPFSELERLWNPTNLENLARTYWRFLSRVTLGLTRVVYGRNERRVVFLIRPLTLLRFDAPEYVLEPDHGKVIWRIKDGLLVARNGRGCGFLALDVRLLAPENGQARLRIEVEVANFYPAIAAGFSMPVYEATQSSIHVLVTHAFLRSLATLDLAESKVGRLTPPPPVDGATTVVLPDDEAAENAPAAAEQTPDAAPAAPAAPQP